MTTTLYRAGYLLPIDRPFIEDGGLAVRGGRILASGPYRQLKGAFPDAVAVDLSDGIVLPPLVNAHTHLELTHFPLWAKEKGESAEPASFVDWILKVIRVKRGLDPQRYLPSLAEGIRLSLAAGTGAVGDILSYFPAREGYKASPLLGHLYLETLGRNPEPCRRVLQSIGEILAEGRAGSLTLGVSPHSPYTLSDRYMEEVVDFARRRQVPVSLHLAESKEETAYLESSAGDLAEVLYPFVGWQDEVPPAAHRTPVAYLEERGGLLPGVLLAHGVQVSAADAERLAQRQALVVLCPRSNARLGVGKAPVALYRKAGIPLALGTDSLASCDSLSLWDEMAFARTWFDGELSAEELLRMATLNGARALGLEGKMGALLPGSPAHFQVLRPSGLPSAADLSEFLCRPGRTADVQRLYLYGRDVLQKA